MTSHLKNLGNIFSGFADVHTVHIIKVNLAVAKMRTVKVVKKSFPFG